MSRWTDSFNNHAFQQSWKQIVDLAVKVKVGDKLPASITELARLKKVVKFINELIISCDPELMPPTIWNNMQGQSQELFNQINAFNKTNNIQYLLNANNNLDNILSYICPYIASGKNAAQAAGRAFKTYANTMEKQIRDTEGFVNTVEENKNTSLSLLEKIQAYTKILFEGTGEEESIQQRINELLEQAKIDHSKISNYHEELTKGNETEASIILQISEAKEKALEDTEKIIDSLDSVKGNIKDLNDFYIRIFGKKDKNGKIIGGIDNELNQRMIRLGSFQEQQEKKYPALLKEIESLLPGATSAGLSTAYKDLRDSSERQVKKYTKIFYVALGLLALMAFSLTIHKIDGFVVDFIDIKDPILWLKSFTYKLPLLMPLLWLTLFASKRRSEFQRLQQEYAHKEAITKSYHGFKKQIDSLNDEDKSLVKKLLETAITAISFNASTTLDNKHGDKLPMQEIVENALKEIKE